MATVFCYYFPFLFFGTLNLCLEETRYQEGEYQQSRVQRLTDKVKARNEKEKESSQIQKDQHHLLQECMCLESGREHPDMKLCASNACRRFLIDLIHPHRKLNKYTDCGRGNVHTVGENISW